MSLGIQRVCDSVYDFLNFSESDWDNMPLAKKAVFFGIAVLLPIIGSITIL